MTTSVVDPEHAVGNGAAARSDPTKLRGPVLVPWREGTLTRAEELAWLCEWVKGNADATLCAALVDAVELHLEAAREAAEGKRLKPRKFHLRSRNASLLERAKSNLDAAEALLLNFAPADYVLGQMPSLQRHVRCHLPPTDPRRLHLERIVHRLDERSPCDSDVTVRPRQLAIISDERGAIVTAVRGASSASLREQLRVRSFRNVLAVTPGLMAVLAVALAVVGWFRPTMIPLCFAPEDAGQTMVVCPTQTSGKFSATSTAAEDDNDVRTEATAERQDILLVELVGLAAAAVAAAAAIRGIKGSSERLGVPIALVLLKLPTGAITAVLGLLLMRGQFVPGLSALDTSAQILAWALVFGYAQQLFTRLVDRQGQTVLDSVRGADKPPLQPPAP
jgi:hypothetical protein